MSGGRLNSFLVCSMTEFCNSSGMPWLISWKNPKLSHACWTRCTSCSLDTGSVAYIAIEHVRLTSAIYWPRIYCLAYGRSQEQVALYEAFWRNQMMKTWLRIQDWEVRLDLKVCKNIWGTSRFCLWVFMPLLSGALSAAGEKVLVSPAAEKLFMYSRGGRLCPQIMQQLILGFPPQ